SASDSQPLRTESRFILIRITPISHFFPYTTLFRSNVDSETISHVDFINGLLREDAARLYMEIFPKADDAYVRELIEIGQRDLNRSEEHTSELQSRFDLVCRLLHEKKKKQTSDHV